MTTQTQQHEPAAVFPDVDVRLHAHACVEIEYRGFRLLTDPWLTGPAFLGAWTQFPPPVVRASELSPNAILITHEHSDHFHEPTLDQFARSTPIFVADFPNQRIPRVLDQMGFADVRPLAFGEMTPLDEHLSITAYEPESVWNDAIYLIEVGGFRILNLNDAGINRRIEPLVCPVDLIIVQASQAPLADYREMLDLYGASHILPCGSHYALWEPDHHVCHWLRQCPKSSTGSGPQLEPTSPEGPALAEPVAHSSDTWLVMVAALQQAIDDTATVLPLLPGSSWNAASDEITHVRNGVEPTPEEAATYCERTFDADLAEICRQPARMISCDELSSYFVRLNHTPEAAFCEDMTARVVVYGDTADDVRFELGLIIADGRIGITTGQPPQPDVTLELPLWAVSKVVLEDLSWDELRLGHWGRYEPKADKRHTAFWRMLQAPYFQRRLALLAEDEQRISHTTVVVNIIERSGAQAERILRRYGLHDATTLRSAREPLATAAAEHGLDPAAIDRLVGELRRACA